MTTPEAEAERLLQCARWHGLHEWCTEHGHHNNCPAIRRPAVAAALEKAREYWLKDLRIAEATLQAKDAEIAKLRDILSRKGYRESCDIPACNCGNQWVHGGHAETRLSEIYEELYPLTNGKIALDAIKELRDALATAEQKQKVLIEILKEWRHWYDEDSTEFNRDTAYHHTNAILAAPEATNANRE